MKGPRINVAHCIIRHRGVVKGAVELELENAEPSTAFVASLTYAKKLVRELQQAIKAAEAQAARYKPAPAPCRPARETPQIESAW